jgi:hypothetical protein
MQKGDLIRLLDNKFASSNDYIQRHGRLWVVESVNTYPKGQVYARSIATGHAAFFTDGYYEEAPDGDT